MMTLICKQCGKTFTLSDSEIEFYKNKGLNTPKRCKECRKKNKAEKNINNTFVPAGSKSSAGFSSVIKKVAIGLAALVAVIVIAVLFLNNLNNIPESPGNDVSVLPYSGYETEDSSDIEYDTEENNTQTDDTDKSDTEIKTTRTQTAAEKTTVKKTTTTTTRAQTTKQTTTASSRKLRFRNSNLLNDHYEKHGKEMGFSSPEAYEAAAGAVVRNPNSLHKKEAEDNDDVYYLESTNEFVVVSTDGYIRTYFKPSGGKAYFDRQ